MTHDPSPEPLDPDLDLDPEAPIGFLAPRLVQFAAVARREHVTRAAADLAMPQPTLSRSIARLESELGVELLAREGRTVRLTRLGRVFLDAVERALGQLARGADEVRAESAPGTGRVAFGFLHTMGSETVPELLRGFRAAAPGVRFQLVQDYAGRMLDRLRSGELDLCLVSPLPDRERMPDLTARHLGVQRLDLCVPAGHRLAEAGRQRVRLAEVAEDPFIALEPGYGLRRITDALCAEAGFEPRIAFEGEETETLRGLVAAGFGVALLPPSGAPRAGVVELRVTGGRAVREIGLAWPAGRRPSAPAAAFRDYVLSRAGHLPLHG
ncbi:LysR family transcriptional regulator [Phaeacidiphilus oryzae]|uniref:LysR family transcriptional regulator n=1 Tax=Phaeacidiphilus oryzae TaxID=348818 RepID=UPI000A54631F